MVSSVAPEKRKYGFARVERQPCPMGGLISTDALVAGAGVWVGVANSVVDG